MFSLKIFSFLLIASCVYANPVPSSKPTGLKGFFQEYAGGHSKKNFKPMDPMIIKNINVPEEDLGINSHFSELTVTGLKNADVASFTMDNKNVSHLDLSFKLDAEGPVTLQFPKKDKNLEGTIKYEAEIKAHLESFNIDEFRPESVTCEASNAKYTISDKFIQVLENDPDASAIEPKYDEIHNEHVKKVSCELARAVVSVVIDNLRAKRDADQRKPTGLRGFFQEYADGDAEKNFKPMDPMIIKNINVPEEDLGINSHFSELTVTGLKNADVASLTTDYKNVGHLDLSFKLDAEGPVTLQFPKKNKNLEGTIKYEADIEVHLETTHVDDFRPESATCEASNAKYTISDKFIQVLENDPDASAIEPKYDEIHNEHVKKVACELARAVVSVVIDNLRTVRVAGL